ncbi:type VI secretion system contractile sheath small subunit, partial [Klebsiella pneumoniae]
MIGNLLLFYHHSVLFPLIFNDPSSRKGTAMADT